ncbi:hypothetical protein OEZ85_002917 [Tetradesmus obliquus]|uniref:YrhK domain-containing protein n=1 Tax=Tetradesmus obliquus TaxID=3088 RepID=A0ABY8TZT7_TETOB|nr:hypothetical protein OEZ85_002917 [Tetradesmus obliquus]
MHRDHALPADSSFTEGSGPRLGCFQPTHAVFHHGGTTYHWNSRYHRKGRYPAVYSTVHHQGSPPRMRLLPIWFGYPFADISYWVGLVFTLGCVAWVINGHYALFESGGAVARNAEQALTVSAAAALVGGTLFEIGSWLLYWEALNPEPHVLIGATIFWVPCMFGAPTAYPAADLTNDRTWDGVYWLFQVVGASFFIASSLLFMLEVQAAWWRPKPLLIGWHVGFWNLVGSVGFWLSGLFGFWAVPSGRYQLGGTILSTFWGSYAFLIGSYVQLLEAVNKHPQSLSCRRVAASK